MKTKTTITETKEVEIDLPDYVWDKVCHWYKIAGENSAIEVAYASHVSAIKTCSLSLAVAGTWAECTKQEFEEAFNEICYVVNYFNSNSEKKSKEFSYGGYDFIGYDPEGSIGGRLKDSHQTATHIINRYTTSNYWSTHFSFENKKHPVNKRVKDTYPYLEQEEKKEPF